MRYLGTLFVYQFGLNAILPYLVLFIVDDIHQTQQVAFALSAGLLVVTARGGRRVRQTRRPASARGGCWQSAGGC